MGGPDRLSLQIRTIHTTLRSALASSASPDVADAVRERGRSLLDALRADVDALDPDDPRRVAFAAALADAGEVADRPTAVEELVTGIGEALDKALNGDPAEPDAPPKPA